MTSKAKLRTRIMDLENEVAEYEAHWHNTSVAWQEAAERGREAKLRIAELEQELAAERVRGRRVIPVEPEPQPDPVYGWRITCNVSS